MQRDPGHQQMHLASWVASPFGDCQKVANRPGLAAQWRDVACLAAMDASDLPEAQCEGVPRPRSWELCSCGILNCPDGKYLDATQLKSDLQTESAAQEGRTKNRNYVYVGCLG